MSTNTLPRSGEGAPKRTAATEEIGLEMDEMAVPK
jgi:hypothetical protein